MINEPAKTEILEAIAEGIASAMPSREEILAAIADGTREALAIEASRIEIGISTGTRMALYANRR